MLGLGVDPGTTKKNPTGWGLVNLKGGKPILEGSGILEFPSVDKYAFAVDSLVSSWPVKPDYMVIENQHLEVNRAKLDANLVKHMPKEDQQYADKLTKTTYTANAMMALVEARTVWVTVASLRGIPFIIMQPSMWRKSSLVGWNWRMKSDECKTVAINTVRMLFGSTKRKDEAEAICMAYLAATTAVLFRR